MAGRSRTQSYDFKNYPPKPMDLSEGGQVLWVAITRQFAADHFSNADLALLLEFCRSAALVDHCGDVIRAEGAIVQTGHGPKPHPAVTIRNGEIRNMTTLATKLRLPLSSRFRAESRGNEPVLANRPWEHNDLIAGPDDRESLLA